MAILKFLSKEFSNKINEEVDKEQLIQKNSNLLNDLCQTLNQYFLPQLARYSNFTGISSPVTWEKGSDGEVYLVMDSTQQSLKNYDRPKHIYTLNSNLFDPAQRFDICFRIYSGKAKPLLTSSNLDLHLDIDIYPYPKCIDLAFKNREEAFFDHSCMYMQKLSPSEQSILKKEILKDPNKAFLNIVKKCLPKMFDITQVYDNFDRSNDHYGTIPPYTTHYKGKKLVNADKCIIGTYEHFNGGYFQLLDVYSRFGIGLFEDSLTGDLYLFFHYYLSTETWLNYNKKTKSIIQNNLIDEQINVVIDTWKNVNVGAVSFINSFCSYLNGKSSTLSSIDDFDE